MVLISSLIKKFKEGHYCSIFDRIALIQGKLNLDSKLLKANLTHLLLLLILSILSNGRLLRTFEKYFWNHPIRNRYLLESEFNHNVLHV